MYRVVGDPKAKRSRKRKKAYGPEVLRPLKRIWAIMDFACGKRLAPCMEWLVPKLEECGELDVPPEVRERLLSVSRSTIDRLLAVERKKLTLKGRSLTKPGSLLKHQIPIRTFSQWDEERPGFTEVDLVDHGGGSTQGEYLFTLDVTDVATGWTEIRAVKNRAQRWVFEALGLIRERLPFPLLGRGPTKGGCGQRWRVHQRPSVPLLPGASGDLHQIQGGKEERQLLRGAEELVVRRNSISSTRSTTWQGSIRTSSSPRPNFSARRGREPR
jgi:hypothetical protein